MKVYSKSGNKLFEKDPEIAKSNSEVLTEQAHRGLEDERRFSEKLNSWNPKRFKLNEKEKINEDL